MQRISRKWIFLAAILLPVLFCSFGPAQEKPAPLTLEKIEEALKEGALPQGRLATIIRDQGIGFEATEEVKERLRRAGADTVVLQAIERASVEYAKRRVEEEKKRIEEAKRKEGERRKAEEEARRRAEEERRRREMVFIPAGEFWMGSTQEEVDMMIKECIRAWPLPRCRRFYEAEMPRRRVFVDQFYIDMYEVTNAQFKQFVDATGYNPPVPPWFQVWNEESGEYGGKGIPPKKWVNPVGPKSEPNHPVVRVTWQDAEAYCKWAGKKLPTEAEWEKAARGTDGRRYPWGDHWEASRANSKETKLGNVLPVGSYPSGLSPYGIHDMAGNVWEWVADWYDETYYQRANDKNPKGPDSGQVRVLRGGSWVSPSMHLRSSFRLPHSPANRSASIGFRCAQ
ncbi:MAG: formylglycine-generating enzyme family protein [Deltaproteobacteria bacterium]|nr:formylglycine-generating enzyme family protein [Deltaproteobacteria bacterium]